MGLSQALDIAVELKEKKKKKQPASLVAEWLNFCMLRFGGLVLRVWIRGIDRSLNIQTKNILMNMVCINMPSNILLIIINNLLNS